MEEFTSGPTMIALRASSFRDLLLDLSLGSSPRSLEELSATDCVGGKGLEGSCSDAGSCSKYGMVVTSGESAHGRSPERSCCMVGSMNLGVDVSHFALYAMLPPDFMKERTADEPQGRVKGLSNVLPKRMSSAL